MLKTNSSQRSSIMVITVKVITRSRSNMFTEFQSLEARNNMDTFEEIMKIGSILKFLHTAAASNTNTNPFISITRPFLQNQKAKITVLPLTYTTSLSISIH